MSRRTDRVASLIRTELGELVLKKLKDPRARFVTITQVGITPDLKLAKVFYSMLGTDEEKGKAGLALAHAAGFLQREIAISLKLRFTPRLIFQLDDSLEEVMRIDRILHQLKDEEKN